jgi:Flp pilus assembly protein TadG
MTATLLWRAFFRLAKDQGGNTLAIAAASLVPLLALIGGGVDIGRAYMARTQLQSACDAAVLAGRRAMSVSGAYGDAEKSRAQRMFDFNFDAAAVRAKDTQFSSEDNDLGQVNAIASTVMPTVIMAIFGKETIALNVACMAELQIANADVMFVLDTTGSMAGTRIAGLRDAVRDFHRTMNEAVKEDGTRIRYGFVPYSVTVNAKELVRGGDLPTLYFTQTTPYQSREALFNTPVYVGTTTNQGTTVQTHGGAISEDQCHRYGRNEYPNWNGSNPETTGSAPGNVNTYTYSYGSWTPTGGGGGTCARNRSHQLTTYETKFRFTRWRYRQLDLDTADLVNLGTVPVAVDLTNAIADQAGWYDAITLAKNNGITLQNVAVSYSDWNGCIEERSTVNGASWNPIPDEAYDLDIDLEPYSDATRWRPYWGAMVYRRNTYNAEETTTSRNSLAEACPSPMQLFREVELSDQVDDVPEWLESYLGNLAPRGNTYHDIGMIWGARLASSRGIFEENVNEGDHRSVSRHLIFMTDGQMEPNLNVYSAYGVETFDNRIAPRNSNLATVTARHNARFLAACEQAKAQGITLWVIAFGTGLTNNLRNCASSGRAYTSNNTDELRNTFKFIASQVADLRLGA